MMLKNCVFHEPVVSCDSIAFGTVSVIECLHKIISTLGSAFNRSGKILNFPKNVTFLILDACLQPCSLVNVLKAYIR